MEMPSYYTITPAPIRYSDAPPREILMYGEITALSNKYGYCTAGNDYFARLYDKDKGTVSGWITDMVKRGWIRRELIMEGNQVKQRRLYLEPLPIPKKSEGVPDKNRGGYPKKIREGTRKNLKENSTSVNTTSINNDDDDKHSELTAMQELNMIGVFLNGIQTQDFIYYSNELGDDVVKHAVFRMAKYKENPSYSYLESILRNYENKGVKSLEEAVEVDKKFEQRKKKRNSGYSRKSKPPIDFTDSHRFDDM